MASTTAGGNFRRQIFLSEGQLVFALVFIAIGLNMPSPSHAQTGFLSIDCGSTKGNYTDIFGLHWVTDDGTYIKSGKSFSMPSVEGSETAAPYLRSFRYFPEGRRKYCYDLPTTPNATYLIRAIFYMNGTVLNERKHFLFIVSINATKWFSLADGDNLVPDLLVWQEGIFYSPGAVMYLCLQPVVGIPFISSLELRELEPSMYQYSGSTLQYLTLLFRFNIGAGNPTPVVRYPNDRFDRYWVPLSDDYFDALPVISKSTAPDQTIRPEVYYVPPEVMRDGWLFSDVVGGLTASLFYDEPQVSLSPGAYAFFVLYTEHLNASDSQIYPLTLTVEGQQGPPWNFTNRATMLTIPNYILSSNNINYNIALQSGARLADGPTLNAVEGYTQYNFNFSKTNQPDDYAITALKENCNLTDWQGDPCLPVPHDWLDCNLESPTFQPIRQPCFSEGRSVSQCIAEEGFLRSTYYVINVSLSNLPTSSFDILKASSVTLGSLTNMSITHSGVDGQTFQFLINEFSNISKLTVLDFSHNAIDSIPDWQNAGNLVHLDLAYNSLTDLLISPHDLPLPTSLQTLNLGSNAIASLPASWQSTANSLVILDLSNNKLKGDISSLDRMLRMNSGSLQQLDVSGNNFVGAFSSSLYFSSLSNLIVANFTENGIQGTLDLTIWYDALTNVALGNVKAAGAANRVFSFVNNNITSIVPDVGSFDAATLNLLETQQVSGILLGGNPYCKGASSYFQRYLCRSAFGESVEVDHKKKSDLALILGICAGIIVLILLLVIIMTLWNLWKQVFSLREIQRALAARKVQPPFFQYSDLKLATRDFHRANKLGHGSFGVVYKGVLGDGTLVAVKKLFISQRQQLLDEFLNEVVLITGIKHRNLVQLNGCCIKDKQRMLVYEYAENGNLAEALWGSKDHGGLNWEQRYNICIGVARGLSYLHEELQPSIIHRDIKPANILLDKNCQPKIADFGLARHLSEETNQSVQTEVAGTLGYFAPEYAMHGQLSNKADVYSYGIVVLEIVSGRKCIDYSLPQDQKLLKNWACALIRKGLLLDILEPDLRECCVPAEVIRTINIALLCVQHHSEKRPSMSQVVTMLSGKVDFKGFLSESNNMQSNFEDLLVTISSDIDYQALQKLADDSTMYKPLSLDSLSSSTSRTEEASIELSAVRER